MQVSDNIPLQTKQFPFKPFTKKQFQVMTWWLNPKYRHVPKYDNQPVETLICDGAIRSGKTLIMSVSYILYAMTKFDNKEFGIAGYSIGTLHQNMIDRLIRVLKPRGYKIHDISSGKDPRIVISFGGKTNTFRLFGTSNKQSVKRVKGMTAAAFLLDEVSDMPREFIHQAYERLSYDDSTIWFNCNPAGPYNYFKREWIDKPKKHRVLRLQFRLDDNPALSDYRKDRLKQSLSGVTYQRDILGKWVIASGLVYSNFDKSMIKPMPPRAEISKYIVSCDYGAQNPTAFGLFGYRKTTKQWYFLKEYFYDARHSAHNKSDAEYAEDLDHWLDQWQRGLRPPIIVDPAAQNFVITLEEHGYEVLGANKNVLNGIRLCQINMNEHKVVFTPNLPNTFAEFHSYIWDEKAENKGIDKVVKSHDHIMDFFRYFNVDEIPPVDLTADNGVQLHNYY